MNRRFRPCRLGGSCWTKGVWNRPAGSGVSRIKLKANANLRFIGRLLRVGPNQVLFADAETYRRLSGEHSLFFKGSWCPPSATTRYGDILSSKTNGEECRVNGTARTPGVSDPILLMFSNVLCTAGSDIGFLFCTLWKFEVRRYVLDYTSTYFYSRPHSTRISC